MANDINYNQHVQSSLPIKVGVVGCGYWGQKIIHNLSLLNTVFLEKICDLKSSNLEEICNRYPSFKATTKFDELLDSNLDAIIIATPAISHYELAKSALKSGKHVLVEKPLTVSSIQAKKLIELADELELILLVGHTFEYAPAIQKVAELISSNELGKIHYINSVRGNLGLFRSDVNVLWDLAIHDLSILRHILSRYPLSVSASGKACININNTKIHDVATLSLDYPQEILATIRVSWLEPEKIQKLTIVGDRKILVYDPVDAEAIIIYDRRVKADTFNQTSINSQLSYHYGNTKYYSMDKNKSLGLELEHFVKCIQGIDKPQTDGLIGLQMIEILEAAQQSLMNYGSRQYLNSQSLKSVGY
ncbi:MAG: Gfo/Idh/MocA family oxidoreductase [Cyanobacteria bacterium P01_D01_bin.50]